MQFDLSGYSYWDRGRPARIVPQGAYFVSEELFSRFALSAGGTPAIPVRALKRFPKVKQHHMRYNLSTPTIHSFQVLTPGPILEQD